MITNPHRVEAENVLRFASTGNGLSPADQASMLTHAVLALVAEVAALHDTITRNR